MAIEITNNCLLKPSNVSPFPLHNTYVPLTVFDKVALNLHVPILYAFHSPTPSNSSLKEGLSKVLTNFPHLAGRMTIKNDQQTCISINSAGVRFIETKVPTTLSEKSLLDNIGNLTDLYPPVNEDVEEILQVQLNRFACGGLVIGLTVHHRVVDGQSTNEFLLAWGNAVRDDTSSTTPSPYLDRAAFLFPDEPPMIHEESDHGKKEVGEPCSIVNLAIHFSAQFMVDLKATLSSKCTTFECLLAHVWKKITIARGLKDEEITRVRIAVNGRRRMRPVVPKEYFGNLILWAYPTICAGDLVHDDNYARTIKVIHEAIARVDDGYFRSFIGSGKLLGEGEEEDTPESGSMLCPNLEVDSWLSFQYHDFEFGSGKPCAVIPPNIPIEGLMVFVPSCKEIGGIDVFVALCKDHADALKRICYSLD